MRTLSRLLPRPAWSARLPRPGDALRRKEFTFRDPVLELISGAPPTVNATTGATPIMTARASTRGDITEDPTRTSGAGVTATGISDYD